LEFIAMKVWIDQDLCTGDGICSEICEPLFAGHDDGLWYVKEAGWKDIYEGSADGSPALKSAAGTAEVPEKLMGDCIEAAEECPGECIMLEI
jgi:ferredoxin